MTAREPITPLAPRLLPLMSRRPVAQQRALLSIRSCHFRWQDQYRYVEPVFLPAGTSLHLRFVLAKAHYALGASLNRAGRFAEAIAPLARAIALDPQQPDAYYYLARASSAVDRPTDALAGR